MTEQTYPQFRNYEIFGLIGAGGMGSVYRARTRTDKTVALKVVHEELGIKDEFRDRFYAEAKHLDNLGEHPNIVQLVGLFGEALPGRESETLFIVMEYVDSESTTCPNPIWTR